MMTMMEVVGHKMNMRHCSFSASVTLASAAADFVENSKRKKRHGNKYMYKR